MPTDKGHHHQHDDHLYDQAGIQNEDVSHEHSDINVRAILAFCVGLVVIAVIIHVSMWGLFLVFEKQAAANDPVLTPHAQPAGQLPPEPRLLTNEPQNLDRFQAEMADRLKGIDEGKKQLLQQGLPVRADAPSDPWMGTPSQARGESSGGRMIPIRPGVTGPAQPVQPAAGQPQKPPSGGGGH